MARHGVIVETTLRLAEPVAAELGLDLVDVEYVREGKDWYLRIYIDKRGGVTLDDCVSVSRTVDPLIEAELEIREAYHLEVSSPGLGRPLKKPADFKRHMGEAVEASLYKARDGMKRIEGTLEDYDREGVVTIRQDDGTVVRLTKQETAKVKRTIRF